MKRKVSWDDDSDGQPETGAGVGEDVCSADVVQMDEEEAKRLRRVLRNRLSAQQARDRKKQELHVLQKQVAQQQSQIVQLERELGEARQANASLHKLVLALGAAALHSSPPANSPSCSYQGGGSSATAAAAAAAAAAVAGNSTINGAHRRASPQPLVSLLLTALAKADSATKADLLGSLLQGDRSPSPAAAAAAAADDTTDGSGEDGFGRHGGGGGGGGPSGGSAAKRKLLQQQLAGGATPLLPRSTAGFMAAGAASRQISSQGRTGAGNSQQQLQQHQQHQQQQQQDLAELFAGGSTFPAAAGDAGSDGQQLLLHALLRSGSLQQVLERAVRQRQRQQQELMLVGGSEAAGQDGEGEEADEGEEGEEPEPPLELMRTPSALQDLLQQRLAETAAAVMAAAHNRQPPPPQLLQLQQSLRQSLQHRAGAAGQTARAVGRHGNPAQTARAAVAAAAAATAAAAAASDSMGCCSPPGAADMGLQPGLSPMARHLQAMHQQQQQQGPAASLPVSSPSSAGGKRLSDPARPASCQRGQVSPALLAAAAAATHQEQQQSPDQGMQQ